MLEGKPSLMQGDSALLSTLGMSGGGPQYGVSASCSNSPPSSSCGELGNVSFLLSRKQVRRQHSAVEMAESQLGYEVIFPSKVVNKDPQVVMVEDSKLVRVKFQFRVTERKDRL
jgi:hypothetical protein